MSLSKYSRQLSTKFAENDSEFTSEVLNLSWGQAPRSPLLDMFAHMSAACPYSLMVVSPVMKLGPGVEMGYNTL